MVKRLHNPSLAFNLPSATRVSWLRGVYLLWKVATAVVLVLIIWQALLYYFAGYNVISHMGNALTGAGMLMVMVWEYWNYRIKGVKPTAQTVLDARILANFSYHGRNIFGRAIVLATHTGAEFLGAKHILQAMTSNFGWQLTLARLQLSEADVIAATENDSEQLADILNTSLEFAQKEHSRISWDDLVRGIIRHSQGLQALLAHSKTTVEEAVGVVEWSKRTWYWRPPQVRSGFLYELITPKRNLNKAWSARPTPVLDSFSQNLTELARLGITASARVRDKEVEEALRVLARSDQNSIILVGETGVGKSSIVGDIALKILRSQIGSLKDYKLISLDVGAMLGSKEGFEKLFARATREAASAGNTVLFIGNLSQITKSKTSEGFDIAGILQSALEQSGLQMIATSDPTEYKKYIENNEGLRQFFTPVRVEEMSPESAVLVLEDQSRKIENRHAVLVTLSAVKAAVKNSMLYIHNGKLPDKAVDVLDEAAVDASRNGARRVDASHVEAVMSAKTNVPVGELTADDKDKLKGLKTKIQEGFVGQEEAVDGVVEALKRSRLGVSKTNRPIGTFLFLGPTGVGKTELSKRLADAYFGSEADMIRLDMSEYQTVESTHRLFGAPATAGDIALAGGVLTEAVRKTPFAVLLLDEIEKAHPDILNVFLAVLDEGRMTDSLGNTIDFTHTIIIATSNAQARMIQEAVKTNFDYETLKTKLTDALVAENFRPEFINRFDGVIVFKPLTQPELVQIARIKVAQLIKRMRTNKDIDLTISEEAIVKLAELGYDPAFGARPLERVIREKVEGKVADTLLNSDMVKAINIEAHDIDG